MVPRKRITIQTNIAKKLRQAYLLTELSFGAFISENRFLIITSSLAHAAAALTSSDERPCQQ